MALSEIERERYQRQMGTFLAKRRPPAHIRSKLDIGVRITGQSVEIFSVRPRWDRPDERTESPIAKATYVKAKDVWRVYWMRQDLKWHRYEPRPEVSSLGAFGKLVHEDKHGCFFG
jgi:hypothetical protein